MSVGRLWTCRFPMIECAHSGMLRLSLVSGAKWSSCVLSCFWQVVCGLLREATQYNPPSGCFRVPGANVFL